MAKALKFSLLVIMICFHEYVAEFFDSVTWNSETLTFAGIFICLIVCFYCEQAEKKREEEEQDENYQ